MQGNDTDGRWQQNINSNSAFKKFRMLEQVNIPKPLMEQTAVCHLFFFKTNNSVERPKNYLLFNSQ
jgi:hypothetical protein